MDGDADDGAVMEVPPSLGADAANASATAAADPSEPPPSRPPLVRRSSTDGSGGEKSVTTAPAPPRWRFVKEAKKSMGYSSLHAGSYIRGRSSEELGAKYTAPDIALYKPKKAVAEVDRQPNCEPSKQEAPDSVVEVGKLESRGEHTETEEYAGWAPGLARGDPNANGPRNPYKEWDANVPLSSKVGREHEWHDGQYHPSYSGDVESHTPYVPPVESTPPGEEATHSSPTCVGRLQFQGVPESEDVFVGEFRRHQKALQSVGMDEGESNDLGHVMDGVEETTVVGKGPDVDEENLFQDDDAFLEDGGASRDDMTSSTEESKEEDVRKKRRYCCFLLPLLLLLLAAILGPFLGRKRKGGDDPTEGIPVTTGVVVPPPIIVFVDNETAVPSSAPSSVCPLGFTPFVVDSAPPLSASNVTWRIADACSGEVVAQCLPCPAEGTSLFETRAIEPSNAFLSGHGTLQCLPANGEYALQVVSAEDPSEECCGFDASSVISFDGVPLAMNDGEGQFGDASSTTYFGERDEPCASASPSVVASAQPSVEPSSVPSYAPTRAPTRSPVVFMGPCVPYFQSGADYGVGAQVTADNLVYECRKDSCVSFWFGIGDLADALLTQGWIPIGSCLGTRPPSYSPTLSPSSSPTVSPSRSPSLRPTPPPTAMPTPRPTPQPTRQPTDRPTGAPTCSEPEFDVCFAIDMSGSVCPGDDNACGDFKKMQEFAIEMVAEMEDLPGDSSFSVVEFASDSDLVSGLSSAAAAAVEIDGLKFSAGATNTAGAINDCHSSLRAATLQRKKFIMMITDGQPTEPGDEDKATKAAEEAATSAKAEGSIIIPIFISKLKDFEKEKEALEFMERISSDGTFFDVTGFDSLITLQDTLLSEVANCGRASLDELNIGELVDESEEGGGNKF